MSQLEGIGDEVVVSTVILFSLLVVYLGWIFAHFTFRHLRPAPNRTNVNHVEELHPRLDHAEEQRVQDSGVDVSGTEETNAEQEDGVHANHSHDEDSSDDADLIRARRVEFFGNQSKVDNTHLTNGSVPVTSDLNENNDLNNLPQIDEDAFDIRLKYLDDTERTVNGRPTEVISDFKRRNFSVEFSNDQTVRLIYHGQVLQDERTLMSYGLNGGCCIHVQILNRVSNVRRSVTENDTELDLSQFLWPLLGIFLGVLWMFHFQYREYFATSSTVALFGLSGLFLTVVWGQYTSSRPEQEVRR